MSVERFQFEKDFLKVFTAYSISDLAYDFDSDSYNNPSINSVYTLYKGKQDSLYYYVTFNESVLQTFFKIEQDIEVFNKTFEKICKTFGASGFYADNSYTKGYAFDSFLFKEVPDLDLWVKQGNGYVLRNPYLKGSLLDIVNKHHKRIDYKPLFDTLGVEPSNVSQLVGSGDCIVFATSTPLEDFDLIVPTTDQYFNHVKSMV